MDGTPPHSDTQRPERPRLALRGPLNNQAVDEKSTPTNTHCLTEGNQPKRTPIMKLLSPSVSTKHPTSEESLHPKSFQSWRWVFLAAILLAAVTISTFYFSSAQAQGDDGAITGLTLTSTTAGTLTVSWDAALAPHPPTTALTGPSPPKTTSHGRSTTGTSTRQKPSPPPPSRTSATTPSTRSACVLATTKASTWANPGVAHGQKPPSPLPENRPRRPPLNLRPSPHPHREP